jgi:hypothetical protein
LVALVVSGTEWTLAVACVRAPAAVAAVNAVSADQAAAECPAVCLECPVEGCQAAECLECLAAGCREEAVAAAAATNCNSSFGNSFVLHNTLSGRLITYQVNRPF